MTGTPPFRCTNSLLSLESYPRSAMTTAPDAKLNLRMPGRQSFKPRQQKPRIVPLGRSDHHSQRHVMVSIDDPMGFIAENPFLLRRIAGRVLFRPRSIRIGRPVRVAHRMFPIRIGVSLYCSGVHRRLPAPGSGASFASRSKRSSQQRAISSGIPPAGQTPARRSRKKADCR